MLINRSRRALISSLLLDSRLEGFSQGTLQAEEEARLQSRHPRLGAGEGTAGMAPPDARAWAYNEGAPLDFLRHVEEHEQTMRRLPRHEEHLHHHHHHHHFSAEEDDGGWGAEPDLPEFLYPQYSQHAAGGSSPSHQRGYSRPRQASGMDTFEELFALMHDHVSSEFQACISAHALSPCIVGGHLTVRHMLHVRLCPSKEISAGAPS